MFGVFLVLFIVIGFWAPTKCLNIFYVYSNKTNFHMTVKYIGEYTDQSACKNMAKEAMSSFYASIPSAGSDWATKPFAKTISYKCYIAPPNNPSHRERFRYNSCSKRDNSMGMGVRSNTIIERTIFNHDT